MNHQRVGTVYDLIALRSQLERVARIDVDTDRRHSLDFQEAERNYRRIICAARKWYASSFPGKYDCNAIDALAHEVVVWCLTRNRGKVPSDLILRGVCASVAFRKPTKEFRASVRAELEWWGPDGLPEVEGGLRMPVLESLRRIPVGHRATLERRYRDGDIPKGSGAKKRLSDALERLCQEIMKNQEWTTHDPSTGQCGYQRPVKRAPVLNQQYSGENSRWIDLLRLSLIPTTSSENDRSPDRSSPDTEWGDE
jgi:hypothetical protein